MDSTLDKYSPLPGDTIDAKLEEGEFVLNRNAVDALGVENLKEFNDDYGEEYETIEDIENETIVIPINEESFIIAVF